MIRLSLLRRTSTGRAVGLAVLLVLVLAKLALPAPFASLRLETFDLMQQLSRAPRSAVPVVVVDIDDRSLAQFGRWPWPRTLMARLVSQLSLYGAWVIGFTVVFPEPDRFSPAALLSELPDLPLAARKTIWTMTSNDAELARALAGSTAVLGLILVDDAASAARPLPDAAGQEPVATADDARRFLVPHRAVVANLDVLHTAASGAGVVDLALDPDGAIRRAPLMFRIGDDIAPGLAAEMLRVAEASSIALRTRENGIESLDFASRVVPTGPTGEVWIHYAGAPGLSVLSAAQVLAPQDSDDLALLAGSFVLVGTSAAGLAPRYGTTLGNKLPGVAIQAQLLDNLLTGAALVRPLYATAVEVLVAVLIGFLIVWLQPRLGARWLILGLVIMAAGICGGTWMAFKQRELFDASYPMLVGAIVAAMMGGAALLASRRAAMATLREREQRLRDLQAELSSVSRRSAMEHLSSALAHELNQPLTAIGNYVQACRHLLAEASGNRGRPLELIDKATAQVARASAIIDGLRDIVERGETARSLEDVNQVIEEAVESELLMRAAQGVRLRMALSPALPPVAINRIQIQQVLINLMRNALEAMEGMAPRELSIETSLRDGEVLVGVRDTGPGLPEEVEANLFKPFVSTKERGMGLGLSISRTIIQAHGGQIWAERNLGGGSTFWFTLPLGAPTASPHPAEAQAAAE